MKKTWRIAAAIICLLFCVSAAGCSSDNGKSDGVDTLDYNSVSYAAESESLETGTVTENSAWKLDWDADNKRVTFIDKATGAVWGTTPSEAMVPRFEEDGFPIRNHAQLESALHVYYHNPTNQAEEVALSYTDAIQDGDVYTQRIDNGLRVIFDFLSYEFIVPVDFTIDEGGFHVTVDPTLIADNGEYFVTGVALAPFVCGLQNGAKDSWLFYPDGSGAMIEPVTTADVGDSGMSSVYGDDLTVQKYEYVSITRQVMMPVFGVKKGGNALLGVIDSNTEAASVAYNVGSKTIGYSSVYASFAIRGYSSVSAPRGFVTPLPYIKVFSNYINKTPCRVSYYSLGGDKAGLNGMAETYRKCLTDSGTLKQSTEQETTAAFKFVGGTVQSDFFLGLPTTKLFPLTTVEQATEMARGLSDKIGNDFYIDLVGFGTSGADVGKIAGGYKVAKNLGGNGALKDFSAAMKSSDIPWYMDFDLVSFTSSGNGFSPDKDGAVWPNQQISYFFGMNTMTRNNLGSRYNILSRSKLNKAADTLFSKAKSLTGGLALGSLSNTKFSDYKGVDYMVCNGLASQAAEIFTKAGEQGYSVLADAANDYAAGSAGRVVDAPLYSSDYDFASKTVPFYELVFKGYIPMSSVSVNLCTDEEDALLRCVEAGIAPSYTLTYNYDNELVTSKQSFIFGSSYEGCKGRIAEQIGSVQAYLESIKGAKIVGYDCSAEDVRITVFDNGVFAAVNYGDKEASTAYGTIPAASWITGRV